MIPVVICGEGRNELGSRVGHPSFQAGPNSDPARGRVPRDAREPHPGFIEASLERASPGRADVLHPAFTWKNAPVLRLGSPGDRSPYVQRIRGVGQRARELGAHLCLLVDQDGDRKRERDIHDAVGAENARHPRTRIVAGVPVPKLEGWILALNGEHRTEALTPSGSDRRLTELGLAPKDTVAFVAAVESADLSRLPGDAHGLRRWFEELGQLLSE